MPVPGDTDSGLTTEVRLSSSGLITTNLNTTIQIRFADTVLCSFRMSIRGDNIRDLVRPEPKTLLTELPYC